MRGWQQVHWLGVARPGVMVRWLGDDTHSKAEWWEFNGAKGGSEGGKEIEFVLDAQPVQG
jgi:hypothetical protein